MHMKNNTILVNMVILNLNLRLKFSVLQRYIMFTPRKKLSQLKNWKISLIINVIIFYILIYLLIYVIKKMIELLKIDKKTIKNKKKLWDRIVYCIKYKLRNYFL